EELVAAQSVAPVGEVDALEQVGAKATGAFDQPVDLGGCHVRGTDHAAAGGVEDLGEFLGGLGHLDRRRGDVREVLVLPVQPVATVLGGVFDGLCDVHRARQPPAAAVDGVAGPGSLLLHDLPVDGQLVIAGGVGGGQGQQAEAVPAGELGARGG